MSVITRIASIFERGEQVHKSDDVEALAMEKTEDVTSEGAEYQVRGKEEAATSTRLKCVKHGKENYIKARPGIEVYDTRSKRRIGKENGKDNMIRVFLADRVVMKGYVYLVESITEETVQLKKIGPVG